jgi:hypothetical protein
VSLSVSAVLKSPLCLEDFAILCLKSVEYTIFVNKKKNSKNKKRFSDAMAMK